MKIKMLWTNRAHLQYNKEKLEAYGKVLKLIPLLERTTDDVESNDILRVIKDYSTSLKLLDDFDHRRIVNQREMMQFMYLSMKNLEIL